MIQLLVYGIGLASTPWQLYSCAYSWGSQGEDQISHKCYDSSVQPVVFTPFEIGQLYVVISYANLAKLTPELKKKLEQAFEDAKADTTMVLATDGTAEL